MHTRFWRVPWYAHRRPLRTTVLDVCVALRIPGVHCHRFANVEVCIAILCVVPAWFFEVP